LTIVDILKYWTLCELSDFKSFKIPNKEIKDYSYIEKFNINTFGHQSSILNKQSSEEYTRNEKYPDRKFINNNKTTNIYKLYLGLIKVESFIKFLYDKTDKDIAEKYEKELERINTEEYTYLGYIYLDYNGNIVSIENKSIIINPIFYILNNLNIKRKLNNFDYNSFTEELNNEFSKEYSIDKQCFNIVVLTFNYLMHSLKPKKNYNPFKFLEFENTKIMIYEELYNQLELLSKDNSSEYHEYATIYYQ